jgi:hypothetical protein
MKNPAAFVQNRNLSRLFRALALSDNRTPTSGPIGVQTGWSDWSTVFESSPLLDVQVPLHSRLPIQLGPLGSSIVNVVPFPTSLSTLIRPP